MDGIIPLWKPKGMTSHDCVMKIRNIFQTRKVGHTGTLDPNVEGVLPICVGEATKIVPYLLPLPKTYIAVCRLGIATETEDAEGKIVETREVNRFISREEIEKVLQKFRGEIEQIPPLYSAVRVKGKRLYQYARDQEEVARPKRKVTIFELDNISTEEQFQEQFTLKVVCSAGTYIRTLCVDIGRELGYPAHMSYLRRIEASSFTKKETKTFEELEKAKENKNLHQILKPLIRGLQHLPSYAVDKHMKTKIMHGQLIRRYDIPIQIEDPLVFTYNNEAIAIYEIHPDKKHFLKPIRVFSNLKEL